MTFGGHNSRHLDEIGIMEGTDKSSLCHGYLEHYAREFAPLRDLAINIIEIGVMDGASSRMWRDFFPHAQIIGVDIQERCREFAGERLTIEIGSQTDPDFLDDLVRRYPPTIIIDDGSHWPAHQIFTFERLFPSLAYGGCYVVEDLHGHPQSFFDEAMAAGVPWPPAYFSGFARYLLDFHVIDELQPRHRRDLLHITKSVNSFHGAVLLWRHESYRYDTPHDLRWLEATVGATDVHYGWGHLASYMNKMGAPPARIVAASLRAVTLRPDFWPYYETLLQAAAKWSDKAAARAALQQALALADASVQARLSDAIETRGLG